MATYQKVGEKWRAIVRRKGFPSQSRNFEKKSQAVKWAETIEAEMLHGGYRDPAVLRRTTVKDLLDRYRKERQRPIGRSHAGALAIIEARLGEESVAAITKDRLIRYAKERGCGPVTWGAELSYLGSIFRVARAVWNLPIVGDPPGDARLALTMLGYKMKSKGRERRPTDAELAALIAHFVAKPRQRIPMDKIIPFAIATTMRAEEITRIRHADVNKLTRTVIIRDRKDPQEKEGNDQEVPLLPDAWAIVESMPKVEDDDRIFPFNSKTFSSIFPRACQALTPPIEDLHFHDLRHEGISRLFEAGYAIQEVALMSGHKDWRQLKRYTQITAKSLHRTPFETA